MKRQLDNRASVTLALGLESARNASGVSKLDLANRIRCSPQHIARVEDRTRNPAQALIADVAAELGKTPADLYQLGEMKHEERTLAAARERRRQVQAERNLETILEILPHLDAETLRSLAGAATQQAEAAETFKRSNQNGNSA